MMMGFEPGYEHLSSEQSTRSKHAHAAAQSIRENASILQCFASVCLLKGAECLLDCCCRQDAASHIMKATSGVTATPAEGSSHPLLTPVKVGDLQLSHRLVMSAMTRTRMAPGTEAPRCALTWQQYKQRCQYYLLQQHRQESVTNH
jgi:hypothetical protein